jgi:hypothetical protein
MGWCVTLTTIPVVSVWIHDTRHSPRLLQGMRDVVDKCVSLMDLVGLEFGAWMDCLYGEPAN